MVGKRRNLTWVLVVALLAACGADDSKPEDPDPPPTRVLSDADIDQSNLKLGERKAAVRKRFGPPYKSFLKQFPQSKEKGAPAKGPRLPCDMYRKHEPDIGPESRYALLCYTHGKLALVSVPYTP